MTSTSEQQQPAVAPTVLVVDGHADQREGLSRLLGSVGLAVQAAATAHELLGLLEESPDPHGCLVLEARLRGMSGLELLERRGEFDLHLPFIFHTGHGSIRTCARAFKAGAFDFLEKPANEEELLEVIQQALRLDAARRQARADRRAVADRLARLTPREREALDLLVAGLNNKAACARLGISRKTLGIHRTNLMRKLEVGSLPELLRLVLTHAPPSD
jgi:FixJ family two-component response regulator